MKLIISKDVKAIIFDLDGTLINSAKTVLEILNEIRQKFLKKKKINLKKIVHLLSIGGKILIKKSLELKKKDDEDYYLKIFRSIYLNKRFNVKEIFPNVINFLKKIKKKRIKVIICTNKNSILLKKIIRNSPLKKYVDFYVTSDMVENYKPNKIFLDYIFKKTKMKRNNILYIGDSLIDVKLCKNYNINFLVFKNSISDFSKSDLFFFDKKKIVFNNYKNLVV